MPIASEVRRPQVLPPNASKWMWDSALQLYAPFWHPLTAKSPFISMDKNGHSCTVTGALWTPQGRLFDAVDDKITFGDTSTLAWMSGKGNTTAFKWTILVWLKQTTPATSVGVILGTCPLGAAGGYTGVIIYINVANQTVRVRIYNGVVGQASFTINGAVSFPSTGFNCLGLTYDHSLADTNYNLYINGVWAESGNKTDQAANDANSTSAPFIGYEANIGAMDSLVGEEMVYNRVLTKESLLNIYKATKWRYQ